MAVRKNESMGFVDAALCALGGPRSAGLRDRLDAAKPWQAAEPVKASVLAGYATAKLPQFMASRCGRGNDQRFLQNESPLGLAQT